MTKLDEDTAYSFVSAYLDSSRSFLLSRKDSAVFSSVDLVLVSGKHKLTIFMLFIRNCLIFSAITKAKSAKQSSRQKISNIC